MTQPGYQQGGDRIWLWRVAKHLDTTQLALVNAMAHNVDVPAPLLALQDKLREAQAILFEIFRIKGLLPASMNGSGGQPLAPNAPAVPEELINEQLANEADASPVPTSNEADASPVPTTAAVEMTLPVSSAVDVEADTQVAPQNGAASHEPEKEEIVEAVPEVILAPAKETADGVPKVET